MKRNEHAPRQARAPVSPEHARSHRGEVMVGNGERPLRSLYVARTVPDQKKYDAFLKLLGVRFGRTAVVRTVTSTHLTILESFGVKEKFYNYGYTPHDVLQFRYGLQQYLDKGNNRRPMKVEPDRDAPLTWVPGSQLAVKIRKTDQLKDQRGRAEEYLKSQFGVLPDLRAFEPHITVATVEKSGLPHEICSDPNTLLSSYDISPPTITLNGLEVYLDRIHRQVLPAAQPAADMVR